MCGGLFEQDNKDKFQWINSGLKWRIRSPLWPLGNDDLSRVNDVVYSGVTLEHHMTGGEENNNLEDSYSKCAQENGYKSEIEKVMSTNVNQTDSNDVVHGGSRLELKDIKEGVRKQNKLGYDSLICEHQSDDTKIQCSVCEKEYNNITDYTHHLNMHSRGTSDQNVNNTNKKPHKFIALKSILESPVLYEQDRDVCVKKSTSSTCDNPVAVELSSGTDTVIPDNVISNIKYKDGIYAGHQNQILNQSNYKFHVDPVESTWTPFPCKFCNKSFTTKQGVAKHINSVHYKLKPISCTLCYKSFSSKQALATHLRIIHQKLKPFSCTLCDKTFSQQGNLDKHINGFHNKLKPLHCTLCEKSFQTKVHLRRHVEAIHEKIRPFSCTLCDRSFSTKGCLMRHITDHSKMKSVTCRLCNKLCVGKNALGSHMYDVHFKQKEKSNPTPFSCTLCNNSFESKEELNKHTNDIHAHINVGHSNLNHRTIRKQVKTVHNSEIHAHPQSSQESENDEINFSMDLCAKLEREPKQTESHFPFGTKMEFQTETGNIKREISMDTDNDKSIGNAETFKEKRETYQNHPESYSLFETKGESISPRENKEEFNKIPKQRTVDTGHKTLKIFSCTLCDKSFRRNGNLKSHINAVHRKRKPFTCTLCDKSFLNLGAHVKAVHR